MERHPVLCVSGYTSLGSPWPRALPGQAPEQWRPRKFTSVSPPSLQALLRALETDSASSPEEAKLLGGVGVLADLDLFVPQF